MPLGFNYKLSPDEESSWQAFNDFVKKIQGQGIDVPIKLTADSKGGNGNNDPLGNTKLAIEKQVQNLQDQLDKALDSLTIKSVKLNVDDIIPINEFRSQIQQLASLSKELSFPQVKQIGKEIKQDIQDWSTYISNFNNIMKNTESVSEGLKHKIEATADIMNHRLGNSDGLQQSIDKTTQSIRENGKAYEELRKLTEDASYAQEQLYTKLDQLVIKSYDNMAQGVVPLEEMVGKIRQLGDVTSKQDLTKGVKELNLELKQYGIVLNNLDTIMSQLDKSTQEEVRLLGITSDVWEKVADVIQNKARPQMQKYKKECEEAVQQELKRIQSTEAYINATEKQKLKVEQLANSLNLQGTSYEALSSRTDELIGKLKQQEAVMNADYIDKTTRKYEDLQGTIKNLVVRYLSLQAVLHNMKSYFQESLQYVYELDDAYTDVAISMDISRQGFKEWTNDAREIAQANGLMTTSLMEMVKIYATAGEDITAIQDKLAGTAMIQNITQWDAETTTSAVNSVINQFKLMEKEIKGTTGNISNAIEYLGDNLIGISNALEIDNVKGIQEMVSAIDTVGSVIETAGGSMEWFMGITGTLAERMNATGNF